VPLELTMAHADTPALLRNQVTGDAGAWFTRLIQIRILPVTGPVIASRFVRTERATNG
jgi:hypothetical protein